MTTRTDRLSNECVVDHGGRVYLDGDLIGRVQRCGSRWVASTPDDRDVTATAADRPAAVAALLRDPTRPGRLF